jgi:type 1 glutamine amidotransferase
MTTLSWLFSLAGVLTAVVSGQAQQKAPLKVCLVSGSLEYKSDDSLARLQKHLESHYNIQCSWAKYKAVDDLPGLENLETCDVAIFFTRRMTIKGEQLERIKKYCASGKPIVAIRTASHGFQNWLDMDKEVLGGNYKNHYPDGPVTEVHVAAGAEKHPILHGVKPFTSVASLYRNTGIAKDTNLLLTGSIPEHSEPLAWTRMHKSGRVFYTSLGHPRDFENEQFVRLVVNAIYWTAGREIEKK